MASSVLPLALLGSGSGSGSGSGKGILVKLLFWATSGRSRRVQMEGGRFKGEKVAAAPTSHSLFYEEEKALPKAPVPAASTSPPASHRDGEQPRVLRTTPAAEKGPHPHSQKPHRERESGTANSAPQNQDQKASGLLPQLA